MFSAPMTPRPAPTHDPPADPRGSQLSVSALADTNDTAGYQGYLPNSTIDSTGQPRRPTRLPTPLLHQDTSTSISSSSTGSITGIPPTPSDDSWTQKQNIPLGVVPTLDTVKGGTEYPWPLHPPFTSSLGAFYPNLPPPRILERGPEPSSPICDSPPSVFYAFQLLTPLKPTPNEWTHTFAPFPLQPLYHNLRPYHRSNLNDDTFFGATPATPES
jgi:hypothetical protein